MTCHQEFTFLQTDRVPQNSTDCLEIYTVQNCNVTAVYVSAKLDLLHLWKKRWSFSLGRGGAGYKLWNR